MVSTRTIKAPVFVIGYGNELRGDDALGPLAAQAIADWALPGVCAIALTQLLPELAVELAEAHLAIFVDARQANTDNESITATRLTLLDPTTGNQLPAIGYPHAADPFGLLMLTATLYGAAPPAWLLTMPAAGFELGAPLSPLARRSLAAALEWLAALLT